MYQIILQLAMELAEMKSQAEKSSSEARRLVIKCLL